MPVWIRREMWGPFYWELSVVYMCRPECVLNAAPLFLTPFPPFSSPPFLFLHSRDEAMRSGRELASGLLQNQREQGQELYVLEKKRERQERREEGSER